jgi:hypothetical protein
VLVLNSSWAARRVQQKAVAFIESRFDAKAELGEISLSLFPRLAVTGRDFRLTRSDEPGVEPFVEIRRFAIAGSPLALFRRSVSRVELDGLVLRIRRGRNQGQPGFRSQLGDVILGAVRVRDGRLLIVPGNPAKSPLEFGLHEVTLSDFGFDRSSAYSARLTNPKPLGVIQSEGQIGPWQTRALWATPLSGVYLFNDADLSTIKGIGGRLTSTGSFRGVLERIRVEGTTSSSDFHLQLALQPVPLETRFVATVDGTSGDTFLDEIDAVLGESRIHARGAVASTPGIKGRTVTLQVTSKDARFEDLLRLAVRAEEPPMQGMLDLDTGFELPPGEADVPDRLRLNGRFTIRRGQFASDLVQGKVDELSRRGRGEPTNQSVANVLSTFAGAFSLENGALDLPSLRFIVNGARVELDGDYQLRSEALNFEGALTLDAPLSRTMTGFRSLLLRAIDPLFRRDGAGARLPIKISGTIDKPDFGVDIGRALRRN